MFNTILAASGIFSSLAIGAGVWYRLGKMENKVDFIYKHVNIAVNWKNGSKK